MFTLRLPVAENKPAISPAETFQEVTMPATKLKEYLDTNNIKYMTISHSVAYTAQEIAATSHVPGQELAKTVILNIDDAFAMAVLPASHQVDLNALKKATGASAVRLATETEFMNLFPDCEVGAMPPFGNLYDMPVYADESLSDDDEIAFNACSHKQLIRLSYDDFAYLVKPVVLKFALRRKKTAAA